MTSNSTSSIATASNYESIANSLRERGFRWEPVTMDDVEFQSNNISFSDEWNEFIARIAEITGIPPSEKAATVNSAWKSFKKAIDPGIGYEYRYEHSFDTVLFDALRSSLDDFVDSSVLETNWIVLKNSHIGFGKKIRRPTLGFKKGYAASSDSEYDHGCFVLGKDIRERTSNTNKRKSSDDMEEDAVWFNDMTAVVELKLEHTSCQHFTTKHNDLNKPNLQKPHGPMSQAMMYSMDVWHCLARRGISVKSVPVVVLAGKSESSHEDYICCLEAHIQIPEYCGEAFRYSIDRLVSFNGSTGLSTNEAVIEDTAELCLCLESRDKRAIAIYIRTMRIGLEHAVEVIKNRSTSNAVHLPVSLCCHQLFDADGIIAPLIASPIPCEDHLRKLVIHVHQGELFSVTNPTKAMFSGITPIEWFADAEREDTRLTSNCLVKVSCVSVHSTYISHSDCNFALKSLHDACMNNTTFKKEMSKVLLGYSPVNRWSLVIIMRDLRSDDFMILDHQKIRNDNQLLELWSAFCGLVKSVLLPMAKEDVVHMDIRSTSVITYNILYRNTSENGIELRLIDFDSLIHFESAADVDLISHDDAVHIDDLLKTVVSGVKWKSVYRFLFWQVLWIAFTWHPKVPESTNANDFVVGFLSDDAFSSFRNWLKSGIIGNLTEMNCGEITAETIHLLLDSLTNAPWQSPVTL